MSDSKKHMREEARRHRARIDPASEDIEAAADLFFEKIPLKGNEIVSGYWPMGREFDPAPILLKLLKRGHKCCLPIVCKDTRVLQFGLWEEEGSALKKSAYGIYEPVGADLLVPDILLVPLLAFDRQGNRLGQGGGYYDATLAALRAKKEILAIGVAYAQQACLFNLPTEEHDQRLDWIITPQEAHRFA